MGKHTKKPVDVISKSKNKDQTKIKRFFIDKAISSARKQKYRQQLQKEIEELNRYQTDFEKIHQNIENLSKPEMLLNQGGLGVHVKGINEHVNRVYDHFKANFKVSGKNISIDHINALKSITRAFNVILDESVNCYIDSMTEKFDGLDRLKTTVMVTINSIKENSEKIQNSALIGHGDVKKKINEKVASGSSHSEEPQIIDLCSGESPSMSEHSTLDVGGQSETGQQNMITDGVQAEVQPIFTGNPINGLNAAQFIGAMHPSLESQQNLNAAFAAQTAFQQGQFQRQTISPIQLGNLQQMFNSMNPAEMNHQQIVLYQMYQALINSQFGTDI